MARLNPMLTDEKSQELASFQNLVISETISRNKISTVNVNPEDFMWVVSPGNPGRTLCYKGKHILWFGDLEWKPQKVAGELVLQIQMPYRIL